MEGTEKQNANHIAHRIGERDKKQYPAVKNTRQIQPAEQRVQRQPHERHRKGDFAALQMRGRALNRFIVLFELFFGKYLKAMKPTKTTTKMIIKIFVKILTN